MTLFLDENDGFKINVFCEGTWRTDCDILNAFYAYSLLTSHWCSIGEVMELIMELIDQAPTDIKKNLLIGTAVVKSNLFIPFYFNVNVDEILENM